LIAAAAGARAGARIKPVPVAAAATGLAIAALAGAALVLIVAPIPRHPRLPGTAVAENDPPPAYASALGGSATAYINNYRIATALPHFVGPATYTGEQVLIWRPRSVPGFPREYVGMYHASFNSLSKRLPDLSRSDEYKLRKRRPAELLLLARTAAPFPAALRQLASFQPTIVRTATLRSGSLVLHVCLIRLGLYYDIQAHHQHGT
jgi:hypothetical protein